MSKSITNGIIGYIERHNQADIEKKDNKKDK